MSRYNKLASLLLIFSVFGMSIAADYCNLESCYTKGPHTMCSNLPPRHSPSCGQVKSSGFTLAEQNQIVNVHNALRQRVASGQESNGLNGPQPRASFMPDLVWDNELAEIAQRWVNQCQVRHDFCRDTESFAVGQNIAYAGATGNSPGLNVENRIRSWYDEVKDYDASAVSSFRSTKNVHGKAIGHYTQIVWAGTTKVGCGKVLSKANGFNHLYLVCNYGPAGNVLGQSVYKLSG